MRQGSVQRGLDLVSVRGGIARFGSDAWSEYCAVMQVSASDRSLARVDDRKQEELLAAYAQFLNALTFPFQLVVQVRPVELDWYATRVNDHARTLPPALVAIARDHAAFVQNLARQRTLLERRIYVVVPGQSSTSEASATRGLFRAIAQVPFRLLSRRGQARTSNEDDLLSDDAIGRQLTYRCEEVARQLARAGLRATRLDALGLVQLYHACWSPELARTQRIRRELVDLTSLVVGAEVGVSLSRRPIELHRSDLKRSAERAKG